MVITRIFKTAVTYTWFIDMSDTRKREISLYSIAGVKDAIGTRSAELIKLMKQKPYF